MKFAATAEARLRGLYSADDPRIAWLPDQPDAAEAHLRLDGSCDLVIGYGGQRFPELDVFVERCASHAVERGHVDHRPAWDRWLAATGTELLDAGAQLGAHHRLQVYLRGYYDPTTVARAFAAVGAEASSRLVGNALSLFGVRTIEMMGLELDDERVGAAVYLALRNRGGPHAAALGDAIGFLVSAIRPRGATGGAIDRWRAVAGELLATATEEHVYVSFDPTAELRWVKIDVGARPLALAGVLGRRLGLATEAMIETATARDFTSPAHIGIRFHGESPALSIYHSLI